MLSIGIFNGSCPEPNTPHILLTTHTPTHLHAHTHWHTHSHLRTAGLPPAPPLTHTQTHTTHTHVCVTHRTLGASGHDIVYVYRTYMYCRVYAMPIMGGLLLVCQWITTRASQPAWACMIYCRTPLASNCHWLGVLRHVCVCVCVCACYRTCVWECVLVPEFPSEPQHRESAHITYVAQCTSIGRWRKSRWLYCILDNLSQTYDHLILFNIISAVVSWFILRLPLSKRLISIWFVTFVHFFSYKI